MSLKKNTFLLAIANGILLLTNLFQTMVSSRLLAQKTDFGALQQVLLVTGLLVALMASLAAALNYFSGLYGRAEGVTESLIRRFTVTGLAGSALLALLLPALVPWLSVLFTNPLILEYRWQLALLVFLRLFNTLYPNLCLISGRLRRLIAVNLVQCGLVFSLFFFRNAAGYVPVALLLGLLIVTELVETAAMLLLLLPYARPGGGVSALPGLTRNEWKYVSYLVANGAVLALSTQVDRLIISSGATPAVYSDYSLGTFSNPVVGVLLASMATAFVPVLSALYARQDFPAIFALWKKASGHAAALVLPIICFSLFFGKDIVVFLFTGRYGMAGTLFQLYNCRFLFVFMLFSVTMNAVGLEKYTVVNSLINLASTTVLVFAGWKWAGAPGAVTGSIAAIYLGYIYPVYIIRRKLDGRVNDYFPAKIFFRCAMVCMAAASLCLLLRHLLKPDPARVVLVMGPLYYLACLLMTGGRVASFGPALSRRRRFDAISDALAFRYNGYRMEKMVEHFINALVFYRVPFTGLCMVILKNSFLILRFGRAPAIKNRVLFSFPEWSDRSDYLEICQYAMNQVDDKFFLRLSGLGYKFAFSRRHLVTAIRRSRGLPGLNIMQQCAMAAVMYNRLLSIDEAERSLRLDVKKYVSFSCVLGAEHLLTQYFLKRGIPTYNLQHGVTYIYRKNEQDSIEYTNMLADHHLAWGDFSRDEMIKSGIGSGNIVVAGYPRKQMYTPVRAPRTYHCVVFLSRRFFDKANLEFLSIIEAFRQDNRFPVRFHLKLHPSLDARKYRQWIRTHSHDGCVDLLPGNMTLQQLLHSTPVDFCAVVNSSTYYECYLHGLVALRYHSDDFDLEHAVADDLFDNHERFTELVQRLYGAFDTYFHPDDILRRLQYVLGIPANEYGGILND